MGDYDAYPLVIRAKAYGAEREASSLLKRWDSCSNDPGIRRTAKKMAPFSDGLVSAAREVLADEADRELMYSATHGLQAVLALDGSGASVDVLTDEWGRIRRDEHDAKHLVALLKDVGDSDGVTQLASQIESDLNTAGEANEAGAWAARHAPKVKPGWRFELCVDETEGPSCALAYPKDGPRVSLRVDPVELLDSDGWVASIRAPYDQPSIQEAPPETLADFPAWLHDVGERLGIAFDVEGCTVDAGRQRSLVPIVKKWLVDGFNR